MHSHPMTQWTHAHAFLGAHHGAHERRTWSVVALTAVMMVAEIAGGTLFGSIALIADGWHMGTHVAGGGGGGVGDRVGRPRPMLRRWRSPGSPICSRAGTSTTRASRSVPASSANWRRSPAPSSSA
jgi:hypothetical protein